MPVEALQRTLIVSLAIISKCSSKFRPSRQVLRTSFVHACLQRALRRQHFYALDCARRKPWCCWSLFLFSQALTFTCDQSRLPSCAHLLPKNKLYLNQLRSLPSMSQVLLFGPGPVLHQRLPQVSLVSVESLPLQLVFHINSPCLTADDGPWPTSQAVCAIESQPA